MRIEKRQGFTLVELLVVISIIAILAALLLPVLSAAHKHALIVKARLEMNEIATAVEGYDSTYGRFPLSQYEQNVGSTNDLTFGGAFLKPDGTTVLVGTPMDGSGAVSNNADVMAILMDLTNYPAGGATINYNHVKNPQKQVFLSAPTVADTNSPGVGPDLVYRDPWGHPYVISMDANYDELCRDSYYGLQVVSQTQSGASSGFNGLFNPNPNPSTQLQKDDFVFRGKVMVWSAGPDGKVDPSANAISIPNNDNILSWAP